MRWASALSTHATLATAVTEACAAARAQLGGAPDLALVFVASRYGAGFGAVPALVRSTLGARHLVGSVGGGVLAAGREVEDAPAVAILAGILPGVELRPFKLAVGESPSPEAWRRRLPIDPASEPAILLVPDPFTADAGALAAALDEAFPGATKLGGLASGGRGPGQHPLFLDGEVLPGGAVGIALVGDVEVTPIVAQGCRPVGEEMVVTRCRRNFVEELDEEPAVTRLEEQLAKMTATERSLFRQAPMVALAMRGEGQRQPDHLVRNLVGLDRAHGVLAVGWMPEPGQHVRLHVRDAGTSHEDLEQHLRRQPPGAQAALLFTCLGRGLGLYGEPDHDTDLVRRILGDVPVGGFFCAGEIGPVHGRTWLHGYTASIGLLRARRWD